ncbi:MAG: GAF domain-containing protein [Clostridia bacterium]|nr:GAF domain-containing protein [Clostridia bacterium]
MEFQSILNRIEEQKKDELLSAKLFRYTGLIQAIEFFSQKLNFDQIMEAAFDFVNELLTLEKSAMFISQGNSFMVKKLKGHDGEIMHIKNSNELQNLAKFYGTLIYGKEQLAKFFDENILEVYNVTSVIPLIIDNNLYGFIFISNKTVGDMNSDDYIISESLMKLINNSLENYKRYEELQKANRELDEKIFTLFAINQSSKALLSELSLDVLFNLSVDVFSELTQSAMTGFVLYDEKSETYVLKAFKDIFYKESDVYVNLTSNKLARVDINKIIIDVSVESDVLYFNSIFKEGIEPVRSLKPLYIVLLVKNAKILGFVTLGQSVTDREYKKSIFELIESLASATYIALSNAQLFKQVSEQKKIIQSKLDKLISLNNLMKNINSSTKVDTLLDLTLKTLDISFDVEKALIGIYDKETEAFKITNKMNIETNINIIKPNEHWKKVFEGDTVYDAVEEGPLKYIEKALYDDVGASSGILIVPIYIDRIEIDMLGVMVIFKLRKRPISDQENILTMETIAGHISPVLSNLFTIEEQLRFLLPNYIELFKKDLKNDVQSAIECATDLQVIQVIDSRDFVFRGNAVIDKLKDNYLKVYPFTSNNIFIISDVIDEGIESTIKRITGLNDVKVESMVLGKEFNNFQEFFTLFSR